jgi:hypothetical protein
LLGKSVTREPERISYFADFSRKLQPSYKGSKTGRQGAKTDPPPIVLRLTQRVLRIVRQDSGTLTLGLG